MNDALKKENNEICSPFWAGLLDYKTGTLNFVNVGHNKPLLKHGDLFLPSVLNVTMDVLTGKHYKLKTTHLLKDIIYTALDGVTEAVDEKGNW